MKIIDRLKTWVKRNSVLSQIFYILSLLPQIPPKDFLNVRKLRLIFLVKPYSGLSYPRLAKIYALAERMETGGIEGHCVECGVWNGGSAAIVAEMTKRNAHRQIWLFDSWEGLPEPKDIDRSPQGILGEKGSSLGYQEHVEELLFQKMNLNRHSIHLVKGWFQDTIPRKISDIGSIAFLHLDCDWYESIKFCLEHLYEHVVPGGYIIIDDYGYWQGCKKAVDEFFDTRQIPVTLRQIDDIGVYFQKKNQP